MLSDPFCPQDTLKNHQPDNRSFRYGHHRIKTPWSALHRELVSPVLFRIFSLTRICNELNLITPIPPRQFHGKRSVPKQIRPLFPNAFPNAFPGKPISHTTTNALTKAHSPDVLTTTRIPVEITKLPNSGMNALPRAHSPVTLPHAEFPDRIPKTYTKDKFPVALQTARFPIVTAEIPSHIPNDHPLTLGLRGTRPTPSAQHLRPRRSRLITLELRDILHTNPMLVFQRVHLLTLTYNPSRKRHVQRSMTPTPRTFHCQVHTVAQPKLRRHGAAIVHQLPSRIALPPLHLQSFEREFPNTPTPMGTSLFQIPRCPSTPLSTLPFSNPPSKHHLSTHLSNQ